jgi:hypothetical protein
MIVGGKGQWPAGNTAVNDEGAAGFRNFSKGDFRLCRTAGGGCSKASPAIKATRDGKDIGADLDAIEKALEGVR